MTQNIDDILSDPRTQRDLEGDFKEEEEGVDAQDPNQNEPSSHLKLISEIEPLNDVRNSNNSSNATITPYSHSDIKNPYSKIRNPYQKKTLIQTSLKINKPCQDQDMSDKQSLQTSPTYRRSVYEQ